MDPASAGQQLNTCLAVALLGQSAGPGEYFNLIKVGIFAAFFVGWAYVCQWVDRDTDAVKTNREQWNAIVLSGGITGLAVWLLLPWSGVAKFVLGLAFWLLLSGGAALAYVFHRNGRVVPLGRVLTWHHIKQVVGGGAARKKKQRVDKGQRVRLADAEGHAVEKPADPEEYDRYSAAQELLFDVFWRRTTDADLLVGKDRVRLVYRIDGVALEQENRLSLEEAEGVIVYLKGLAGLNPKERRRPQVGRIRAAPLAAGGEPPLVEVHSSGSTAGERLRLRIHASESCKRLGELGLNKRDCEKLKELIKIQTGLVIISGVKQSGVTCTQYAIIRDHDAFMQNLHSLERAPLLELDNITQNKYAGTDRDVSYARQLQSVLRREPDVVLIGECGDRETAQIACRAAAGERKVYLAIEGKGAFEALERFRQLVDDHALVSKALLGVTNQRLVRVLCPACRQAFRPEERLLKKLNLPAGDVEFHRPPTEPTLDRKGSEIICQTCQGTGYVGRTSVFEIMVADEEVSKLLADGAPIQRIRDQCRRARMHDLRRAGLQKVYDGVTSLDEILRALRFD
ncbi:MAG: ATPase, T2SS/T4P/T4SS family, partial [Planctomycetota bacterium]